MRVYILFTEVGAVISKRTFGSTRELVEQNVGCVAFLGPISHEHASAYLNDLYPRLRPSLRLQVEGFIHSPAQAWSLPPRPGVPR
jgi:hypothetical protein